MSSTTAGEEHSAEIFLLMLGLWNRSYPELAALGITSRSFTRTESRLLWNILGELNATAAGIDEAEALRLFQDRTENAGGFLAELNTSAPSPSRLKQYATEVIAHNERRELLYELGAIIGAGVDGRTVDDLRHDLASIIEPDRNRSTTDLELIDFASFEDTDDTIVTGLVHPGRWTAVAAPAKTGKSDLLVNVAVHLAAGIDPFDRTPVAPCTVLYLDAEMGRHDLRARIIETTSTPPEQLDRLHATDLVPRLNTPDGALKLLTAVHRLGVNVVIIDGINGTVDGPENDDTTWRPLYDLVIHRLKASGIAVLTADNVGHDPTAKRPRGSSVKLDKPDAVVIVNRTDSGLKFATSHRRTNSYPAEWYLSRSGGDGDGLITYAHVNTAWPAGTEAIIALLDELGVDPAVGRPAARKAIKAAGVTGVRDTALATAIRYRRVQAGELFPKSGTAHRNDAGNSSGDGIEETSPNQVRNSTGNRTEQSPRQMGTVGGCPEGNTPRVPLLALALTEGISA